MKNVLFLFAIILFLSSCRTARKTQDSRVIKTETEIDLSVDSSGKHEETIITETKTEEENKTVVEGEFLVDTSNGSGITAKDYEPVDGVTVESEEVPIITIDKDGAVTIKGKIKKFKVTGETKKTVTDSTAKQTTDTSSVSTSAKTTAKTTDEEKHSTTERTGIVETVLKKAFWPVFIAAILFFFFLYMKRKKTGKPPENTL